MEQQFVIYAVYVPRQKWFGNHWRGFQSVVNAATNCLDGFFYYVLSPKSYCNCVFFHLMESFDTLLCFEAAGMYF